MRILTSGYVQCPCCGDDTIAVPCYLCQDCGCETDEPLCTCPEGHFPMDCTCSEGGARDGSC